VPFSNKCRTFLGWVFSLRFLPVNHYKSFILPTYHPNLRMSLGTIALNFLSLWTTVVHFRHFFCLTMLTCGTILSNPLFSSFPMQLEAVHRPCPARRRQLEEAARAWSLAASGWERGRLGAEAIAWRRPGRSSPMATLSALCRSRPPATCRCFRPATY
jgi:hypothetical protein